MPSAVLKTEVKDTKASLKNVLKNEGFDNLLEINRHDPTVPTRIIATSLSKGGVGKTTTAANLAYGLALEKRKVLLIDTDRQAQCKLLLGCNPMMGLYEVINPDESQRLEFSEAVFCDSKHPYLHFLAGNKSLTYWESKVRDRVADNPLEPFAQFEYIKNHIGAIEKNYDYIIFDTAPAIVTLGFNVLFYARELLIPFELAGMTRDSMIDFLETYYKICEQRARFMNNGLLKLKYILPTFSERTVATRNSFDELNELVETLKKSDQHNEALADVKVLTPIPRSIRLKELPDFGQTIFEHAPTSTAGQAYGMLVEEIIKDESN